MPSRVTLADVAREAGVSPSAVSLVLRGRPGVGVEASRRVREAAVRLGYRPDAAATALRSGRTRIAGVLVRNLRNSYFTDLIAGFDSECLRRGFRPLVATSDFDPARERAALRELVDRGAEGVAVAPVAPIDRVRDELLPASLPLVLLDSEEPPVPGSRVRRVGHDLAHATALAVTHLAREGHIRTALYVSSHADDVEIDLVHERVQRAGAGIEVDVRRVSYLDTAEAEADLVARLGSPHAPTAAVFRSAGIALAAYAAAGKTGLTIPEDLAVVAVGDARWAPYLDPPLTVVRLDAHELGKVAARGLIDAIETPENASSRAVALPVTFVERSSTRSGGGGER